MDHRGRPSWELTAVYATTNPGGTVSASKAVDTQPVVSEETLVFSGGFTRYGVEFIDPFTDVRLYGEVVSGEAGGKLVAEHLSGATWYPLGDTATAELMLDDVGFVIGDSVTRRTVLAGDVTWRVRVDGLGARVRNVALQWLKGIPTTAPVVQDCAYWANLNEASQSNLAYFDSMCGDYGDPGTLTGWFNASVGYDPMSGGPADPYPYSFVSWNTSSGAIAPQPVLGDDAYNGQFALRVTTVAQSTGGMSRLQCEQYGYATGDGGDDTGTDYWMRVRRRFVGDWAGNFTTVTTGDRTLYAMQIEPSNYNGSQGVFVLVQSGGGSTFGRGVYVQLSTAAGTFGSPSYNLVGDPDDLWPSPSDLDPPWYDWILRVKRNSAQEWYYRFLIVRSDRSAAPLIDAAFTRGQEFSSSGDWGIFMWMERSYRPTVGGDHEDYAGYKLFINGVGGDDPFNLESEYTPPTPTALSTANQWPNGDFQRTNWGAYGTDTAGNSVTDYLSVNGGVDGNQSVRLYVPVAAGSQNDLPVTVPSARVRSGTNTWTLSGKIKVEDGTATVLTPWGGSFTTPGGWAGDGLYHDFSITGSWSGASHGYVFTLRATGASPVGTAHFDKFMLQLGGTATTFVDDVTY